MFSISQDKSQVGWQSIRLGLAVLLTAGFAACAHPPQTNALLESVDTADLPRRVMLESVPFIPQEKNWCGPAALAMALQWSGVPATQEAIAKMVYTPGLEGALRHDMVTGARRHARLVTPVQTLQEITRELAAGHPVLVFQNLSFNALPFWHYAVAIGYDLDQGELMFHSGTTEVLTTHMGLFERTWKRGDYWGQVVLPPGRLPASATSMQVIESARALERAGWAEESITIYRLVVTRWPEQYLGWMALGNAHMAQEVWTEATTAFHKAVKIAPEKPAGWNNLAFALAHQERWDESETAVDQAVRVGGELGEIFKRSQEEIRAKRRMRH
ncbi:MAG: PA2778 family cysteine peptidase [Magnetococcales bacterium]|nr:PA2778 family cysteine peptidase [Magnetococcales bacterium]